MRKIFDKPVAVRLAALLLALAPCSTLAEQKLIPSADCLATGSVVDFSLVGMEGGSYTYTLLKDGEELFTRETDLTWVSYLPRESGSYTLQAADGKSSVQANFTVTEPVSCTLGEIPAQLAAGEPLFPAPRAMGGTGEYSYIYTITGPNGVEAWKADAGWHWVGTMPGDYTLTVTATDSLGNQAETRASFTITQGAGITVQPSGGALLAHGGQQSWRVFAPGPWTATTTDDFLTLTTNGGTSGESLCITIEDATNVPRQGCVTIVSGECSLQVPVLQSASQGVDEEISLSASSAAVQVEGAAHVAWLNADGAKTFTVTCEAGWTADTEDDFIRVETAPGGLTLTVDEALPGVARCGLVGISSADSTAYIHVYQPGGTMEAAVAVAATPPQEDHEFVLYSQSSGWWQNKPYGSTNLQQSGCAIFALSHALQCLGYRGDEITPERLAAAYANALREGGTVNSYLVGHAADDLGFKTRYDLYDDCSAICAKLDEGAVFSFAVVSGHIAMVSEKSQDGAMLHIIDSAPSATWERIQNAQLYIQTVDGSFAPSASLAELPGIRYYIETGCFGGADYWLEADYVARRGVRLIQKQ